MYKTLLRPWLFRQDAEQAHYRVFGWMKRLFSLPGGFSMMRLLYGVRNPALSRTVMGLHFPNPVGLAAGLDKEGVILGNWEAVGFGFVEIGTVTPRPQPGNPKPRLFRLPADGALINRMGFNSEGVESMVARLRSAGPRRIILGGNIGKNKDTPNEQAADDYLRCFDALYPYVDYFVVNVSSPNTPNLRALQDKEPLTQLLQAVQARNQATGKPRPLLLKIAPDLTDGQLDDILEIAAATGLAGIVATNTTISREGLQTPAAELERIGAGGLSGAPLRARSTEVIRYLHSRSGGNLCIIAVGGITRPEDALEKLRAGASLVQVYTGFVYEGPGFAKAICRSIAREKA